MVRLIGGKCPVIYSMKDVDEYIKQGKGVGVDLTNSYRPEFLGWCKSYEQEEREMRELICGQPSDVKQLKEEYEELTGKKFRRRNNE